MTNANHANVAHRYFDNHAGVVADRSRIAGSGGCDLSVVR
jgi:hypothetical protein